MEILPLSIDLLFGITVVLTIIWFHKASKSKPFLGFVVSWTMLQAALGYSVFYQSTDVVPPRLILFGVFPTLLFIAVAFILPRGRKFVDRIDLKVLTYFHCIRIPVEVVLFLLYSEGLVSVYMTFEGTNFDLLSGLSAPVVAYFAFRSKPMRRGLLLWWNMIAFLLLLNVVITAVFAFPSPFQQLAFDQPNSAILSFPFNLLPSVVVPLVLFGHLVAFRRLSRHQTARS